MRKVLLPLFLIIFSAPLWADIVTLKDGRRMEGKIVQETKKTIVLLVKRGTYNARIPIPKSNIAGIQKQSKTSWEQLNEEYEHRLREANRLDTVTEWEKLARWCDRVKLPNKAKDAWKKSLENRRAVASKLNTVKVWLSLAKWAKQRGFYQDSRQAYQNVIQLDSDQKEARNALGFKKFKGKWLTSYEYGQAEEKDMRLKGYIRHKGKWYTAKALAAKAKMKKAESQEKIKAMAKKVDSLQDKVEALEKLIYQLNNNIAEIERRQKAMIARQKALFKQLYQQNNYYETRLKDLEKTVSRLRKNR